MKTKKLATIVLLTTITCLLLTLLSACEIASVVKVNFYVDGKVYSSCTIAGNTAQLPTNPEKEGYDFDGWYLDDKTFNNAFTGIFETAPVTSVNVYAKWKTAEKKEDEKPSGLSFAINFYVDGTIYATIVASGELKLPANPEKEGYVFDGWYLDDETFENVFTGIFETTPVTSVDVYAKWKLDENNEDEKPSETSIRVNFYVDGIIYAIRDAGSKKLALPTTPVKNGNTFDGWYLDDETFKNAFTGNFDTMPTNTVDVYAKWKSESESENDTEKEPEDVPTDLYYDYKEHVKLFSQIEGATVECVDDPDTIKEWTQPEEGFDVYGNTPYIAVIYVSWPYINNDGNWAGTLAPDYDLALFYFKSNTDALKVKKSYIEVWTKYYEEEADEEEGEMPDPKVIVQGNVMVTELEDYFAETFKEMIRTKKVFPVTFESKLFLQHGYLLQNQTVTADDFIVCLDFPGDSELEGKTQVITSIDCNTQSTGKTTATVKFKYNDTEYTIQEDFEVIDKTHKHYFILENHLKLKELGYKFSRSTFETCLLYDDSIFDGLMRWNDGNNEKILIGKIGGYSEGMLAKSFGEEFIVAYFDTEEHAKQYYEIYKEKKESIVNIVLDGRIAYIDMWYTKGTWALAAKKAVQENKYVEPGVCELTATCKENMFFEYDWQYEDTRNYVVTYKYKVDDEVLPGGEAKWYDVKVTNVFYAEKYVTVTITYKNCSTTVTIPKNN